MNPYDNNPFATDNFEIHSERDANLAMAKEAFNNRFEKVVDNFERYTPAFANGMACGIIDCALDHGCHINNDLINEWTGKRDS